MSALGRLVSIPTVSLGAPVRVISLVEPRTGNLSHIIACEQTWTAAVVDPHPGVARELTRLVEQRALRLRLVLRTRPEGQGSAVNRRYSSLMTDLGLSAPEDQPAKAPKVPWTDLPSAGPERLELGDDEDLPVMAAGNHIRLSLDGSGGPVVTVGGCGGRPPEGALVRGLRAALGPYHIHAVPLGSRAPLAWLVADRLFTGTDLRGGAVSGTPGDLLGLPPETLVYPGHATDGQTVSTIGHERRIASHRRPRHELRGASAQRHLRVHCEV